MNWVLSERSIGEVSTNVKKILDPQEDVVLSLKRKDIEYLRVVKP